MYGRGVASIAEQIGGTIQEAQKIVDDFYTSFPKVKNWITETSEHAHEYGFVEDLWGRRRRLPDIQLPKYDIKLKDNSNNSNINFNPLLGSQSIVQVQKDSRIIKYEKLLKSCRNRKEFNNLKEQAAIEGVILRDNGGFISQAERQCVNARVQGGAATMSKKAMIKVYQDEELRNLGFKLLIAVHDELIGECPKENANKVADRLCDLMKSAALPECTVPFKCDPTIEKVWYYTDYCDVVKEHYEDYIKEGLPESDTFEKICIENCECTKEQLQQMVNS